MTKEEQQQKDIEILKLQIEILKLQLELANKNSECVHTYGNRGTYTSPPTGPTPPFIPYCECTGTYTTPCGTPL